MLEWLSLPALERALPAHAAVMCAHLAECPLFYEKRPAARIGYYLLAWVQITRKQMADERDRRFGEQEPAQEVATVGTRLLHMAELAAHILSLHVVGEQREAVNAPTLERVRDRTDHCFRLCTQFHAKTRVELYQLSVAWPELEIRSSRNDEPLVLG